jgi:hypothetical protein
VVVGVSVACIQFALLFFSQSLMEPWRTK